MTLGEMIKNYIENHNLTYEKFGDSCDLSKGYISMLVNKRNPNTGKPPVPSIATFGNIAKAMGITIDELFASIEDSPVDIGVTINQKLNYVRENLISPFKTENWKMLSNGIANLSKEKRNMPDYETAALRATEALINYRVRYAPISPLPILKSTPNVIVISFSEIASLIGLERDSIMEMMDANGKNAITFVKDINGIFRYIVAYNMNAPFYVLQYSLACELGHILLRHDGSKDDDVREAEVECFANYLLFPRPLLRAGIDAGIPATIGNIGMAMGCYQQCIETVKFTPGIRIPKELNAIVRGQFREYLENYVEIQKSLFMVDNTPLADFGTYMDNYEE